MHLTWYNWKEIGMEVEAQVLVQLTDFTPRCKQHFNTYQIITTDTTPAMHDRNGVNYGPWFILQHPRNDTHSSLTHAHNYTYTHTGKHPCITHTHTYKHMYLFHDIYASIYARTACILRHRKTRIHSTASLGYKVYSNTYTCKRLHTYILYIQTHTQCTHGIFFLLTSWAAVNTLDNTNAVIHGVAATLKPLQHTNANTNILYPTNIKNIHSNSRPTIHP